MATKTAIAWTDHTFNIAWGCTKIGPGCANCYAERLAKRYGFDVFGPDKPRRTFGRQHWMEPGKWNRKARESGVRHRVFSSSMCDNWEDHPDIDAARDQLWRLIRQTHGLDWQLLTKRPERIAETLPPDWGDGWPNVWLGVSIEDDRYAHRAETLKAIPAVVRFVSHEPALGPLDSLDLEGLSWIIYGGESGPGYREHDLAWPRKMRDRCAAAGVPFFYKQSPAHRPGRQARLDGEVVQQFPTGQLVGGP